MFLGQDSEQKQINKFLHFVFLIKLRCHSKVWLNLNYACKTKENNNYLSFGF